MGRRGVALVTVVLSACGGGKEVTGRLLRADQTGAGGFPVELVAGGNETGVATTTGEDGRFTLPIPSDLPNNVVEVGIGRSPSSGILWIWAWPTGPDTPLSFGDIPLWMPDLMVSDGPAGVQLDWDGPPAWFAPAVTFGVTANASHPFDPALVWSEETEAPGLLLDPRKLQDQTLVVVVTMVTVRNRTQPFIQWHEPESGVEITGTAVPLSRGASCLADDITFAAGACAVTDGDFSSLFMVGDPATCGDPGCLPQPLRTLIIDLGAPAELSALTVHAATYEQDGDPTVDVEISPDCLTFTPIEAFASGRWLLAEWSPATARCLRLGFGQRVTSLREVGVW